MSKTVQPCPFDVGAQIHVKAGADWRYGKVIEDLGGTVVRVRIGGRDETLSRRRVFIGAPYASGRRWGG